MQFGRSQPELTSARSAISYACRYAALGVRPTAMAFAPMSTPFPPIDDAA